MEDNENVATVTTENTGVDTPAIPNDEVKVEQTENGVKNDSEAKIYSQAEVDKLMQERVARVKFEGKDEMQKVIDSLQNQVKEQNKIIAKSKYDIKKEYSDYVDYKVSQMTSDTKSYEDALKEFMEGDGKLYLAGEKVQVATPRPENVGTPLMTDTERYIKEKYGKTI